jgi:hypothetical protein
LFPCPGRYDQSFFGSNPNWRNYVLSTNIQLVATGTQDKHPKYGVYGAYMDHDNYYVAMIDTKVCATPGCIATDAVVNGTDQGWQNCKLSFGFNPTAANLLCPFGKTACFGKR